MGLERCPQRGHRSNPSKIPKSIRIAIVGWVEQRKTQPA
jgi:hypothetical protein